MLSVFRLLVILFSIMIHEIFHGLAALKLGDDTAKRFGRLTLNPLAHLDPFGSVLLPMILFLSTGGRFLFGWARPVPYNPFLLKNPHRDTALLALAGPLANFAVALTFGLSIRTIFLIPLPFLMTLIPYFEVIVLINLMMAVFNLIPIPPLDGSKILFYFFPSVSLETFFSQYGLLLLLLFLFFGLRFVFPLILMIFNLLVGYFPS